MASNRKLNYLIDEHMKFVKLMSTIIAKLREEMERQNEDIDRYIEMRELGNEMGADNIELVIEHEQLTEMLNEVIKELQKENKKQTRELNQYKKIYNAEMARKKMKYVMGEYKRRKLRDKMGKPITNRKQAIAIALREAKKIAI